MDSEHSASQTDLDRVNGLPYSETDLAKRRRVLEWIEGETGRDTDQAKLDALGDLKNRIVTGAGNQELIGFAEGPDGEKAGISNRIYSLMGIDL